MTSFISNRQEELLRQTSLLCLVMTTLRLTSRGRGKCRTRHPWTLCRALTPKSRLSQPSFVITNIIVRKKGTVSHKHDYQHNNVISYSSIVCTPAKLELQLASCRRLESCFSTWRTLTSVSASSLPEGGGVGVLCVRESGREGREDARQRWLVWDSSVPCSNAPLQSCRSQTHSLQI